MLLPPTCLNVPHLHLQDAKWEVGSEQERERARARERERERERESARRRESVFNMCATYTYRAQRELEAAAGDCAEKLEEA